MRSERAPAFACRSRFNDQAIPPDRIVLWARVAGLFNAALRRFARSNGPAAGAPAGEIC
jgi:hypothetical protein